MPGSLRMSLMNWRNPPSFSIHSRGSFVKSSFSVRVTVLPLTSLRHGYTKTLPGAFRSVGSVGGQDGIAMDGRAAVNQAPRSLMPVASSSQFGGSGSSSSLTLPTLGHSWSSYPPTAGVGAWAHRGTASPMGKAGRTAQAQPGAHSSGRHLHQKPPLLAIAPNTHASGRRASAGPQKSTTDHHSPGGEAASKG